MATIGNQRKPLNITFVRRLVKYYPNYVNSLAYLKVFLRDNPNREGQVTITGEDWTDVSRWISNNPNHPEVDEVRVLHLHWKPFREDVTVIQNDVVMTLDSLMYRSDDDAQPSANFEPHEFKAQYADRYSQHC